LDQPFFLNFFENESLESKNSSLLAAKVPATFAKEPF